MNSLLTKLYIGTAISPRQVETLSVDNNDKINKNAKSVIETYFSWKYSKKCLISNIQFFITNNKVTIQFFYYIPSILKKRRKRIQFKSKFRKTNSKKNHFSKLPTLCPIFLQNLSKVLQTIYGKRVELILNRIHYPYINAQIFSQYLCKNAQSKRFLHFSRSLFKFPSYYAKDLPAYIMGIKITVHGRLITERIIPRKTMKSKIQGRFTTPKGTLIIDKGYTEMKNRLGQFRITVEIAQIINQLQTKE